MYIYKRFLYILTCLLILALISLYIFWRGWHWGLSLLRQSFLKRLFRAPCMLAPLTRVKYSIWIYSIVALTFKTHCTSGILQRKQHANCKIFWHFKLLGLQRQFWALGSWWYMDSSSFLLFFLNRLVIYGFR